MGIGGREGKDGGWVVLIFSHFDLASIYRLLVKFYKYTVVLPHDIINLVLMKIFIVFEQIIE